MEPNPLPERPQFLSSDTLKFKGTNSGTIYITVTYDETGLREIFSTTGKNGNINDLANITSLCIFASMLLRTGTPAEELAKRLKVQKGTWAYWPLGNGAFPNKRCISSLPDLLGYAIEVSLQRRKKENESSKIQSDEPKSCSTEVSGTCS